MQDTWRLIHDSPLPGKINMKRDLDLLKEVCEGRSRPVLRFYSWSPPALSLGFFQKAEEIVDIEACRQLGIDIVRRPTGGRALLHHRELTYSVIVPEGHPLIPKSVLESYKLLSQGIISGLGALGIKADLAPSQGRGKGLAPGACFDSPSAYEIQIFGKKVVGSAQVRRRGGLLQHGSILQELPLDLYRQILKPCGDAFSLDSLEKKAAGLKDLGFKIEDDELACEIKKGFSEIFHVKFIDGKEETKEWSTIN
ncbi:lipoate--protein ligase family protein [Dethiobacter alkaliphilus]|uniref:lipoate--protein ligase family protein n=1 Tax=Dethiobacter alkaliphilus TaxID=427926 RepID=UPI0022268CB1|nr:biotin/lipoate A/B protein ligase family protein [Dethiobacter alkaliphilus]MCW3489027.1 lipoate--protein ligase family protein [Dethiobacter alkaliphilus]